MSTVVKGLKYSDSHEWVKVEDGNIATVGITDHAQSLLGELVYVELPQVGDTVTSGSEVGVVESVKAASDFYTPVSGTITQVNESLVDNPNSVNDNPYEAGWLFKIELSDVSEIDQLLDAENYETALED
ncbi:glycine cleavage system protein GcvH [Thiotrichales bacterium 19S11-10]|nr:glycine cleavage system protein GcvH [Thiotrichales bacterium 19S11-10]MCF6808306.1 glycine cleavage system protein GcvH [Thiotrichales bacterium 19S9-11]MCF6812322.1 glycine cleavage system protein GcvH [Thiotrichales bacterium 19S9-12]